MFKRKVNDSQPKVFEFMKTVGEKVSTLTVAEGTGLTKAQAGNALYNLKQKGAVHMVGRIEGVGLWEHNSKVATLERKSRTTSEQRQEYKNPHNKKKQGRATGPGSRGPYNKKAKKGALTLVAGSRNAAQTRYDAAMIAMLDAQKELEAAYDELQPYIMSEKDMRAREALEAAAAIMNS